MNNRLKSTAILMALIITLSVFTSLVAMTTATAATTTTTTIAASNRYPLVGQTVTITATLKSGTTLLSKPVRVFHYLNGVRYEDGTHNTVNGVYKFTQAFSSKGQRVYYAQFAGGGGYGASTGTVTVYVRAPAVLTLTTSTTTVWFSKPFTLTGTLTSKGVPVVGQHVLIFAQFSGSTTYRQILDLTTNGLGKVSRPIQPGVGTSMFYAQFRGTSTLAPAKSGTVTVTVKNLPTQVMLYPFTGTVRSNSNFGFAGTLKKWNHTTNAYDIPLAGQTIRVLYRAERADGSVANDVFAFTTTTGADGRFAFDQIMSSSQPEKRIYSVYYWGDNGIGAGASSGFGPTITIKFGTTLSIELWKTQTANYLGGRLTDQYSHPLAGKTLSVYWKDWTSGSWQLLEYTVTNENGRWSADDHWVLWDTDYFAHYQGTAWYDSTDSPVAT